MSGIADEAEARPNADCRLFVSLLTIIADDPGFHRALESLARKNEPVGNRQESPGGEPGKAFAARRLTKDEIRTILKDALARALAGERMKPP
jgi:hypothetical protein